VTYTVAFFHTHTPQKYVDIGRPAGPSTTDTNTANIPPPMPVSL
jgi:hypothetical protein